MILFSITENRDIILYTLCKIKIKINLHIKLIFNKKKLCKNKFELFIKLILPVHTYLATCLFLGRIKHFKCIFYHLSLKKYTEISFN